MLYYHPDKVDIKKVSKEKALAQTKEIVEAYETLSSPQKRVAYDESYTIKMAKNNPDKPPSTMSSHMPDKEVIFFPGKTLFKYPLFNREFRENQGLQFINALIFHIVKENCPEALATCWLDNENCKIEGNPFFLQLVDPYGASSLSLPWIRTEYFNKIQATLLNYGIYSSIKCSYPECGIIAIQLYRVETEAGQKLLFTYDNSKINSDKLKEFIKLPLAEFNKNSDLKKRILSEHILDMLEVGKFNQNNPLYYLKWEASTSRLFCQNKKLDNSSSQEKFACSLEALDVLKKFMFSSLLKDLPHDDISGSCLWRRGGGCTEEALNTVNDYEVCIQMDLIQLAHELSIITPKRALTSTAEKSVYSSSLTLLGNTNSQSSAPLLQGQGYDENSCTLS